MFLKRLQSSLINAFVVKLDTGSRCGSRLLIAKANERFVKEEQSSGEAEAIEEDVEILELEEEEASQVTSEMEFAVDLEDSLLVLENKLAAVRNTNKKLEELNRKLEEWNLKLEAIIMKMEVQMANKHRER
ncbi:unnamed protein product [Hermetia illucens]|uniref:Uncharacterized protein n=1 Tax=Hermetia illucens TaxID=343691 RepID=A0A7R8YS50_HERIL|nr:unnamed protein product [Hermetia illucens]